MRDLETELQRILEATSPGPARRALDILAHYRWPQMARRVWRIACNRIRPGRTIGVSERKGRSTLRPISPESREVAQLAIRELGQRYVESGSDLEKGILCLLNATRRAGYPVDWRRLASDTGIPHLWRFHLQYHEFIAGHAAGHGESSRESGWSAIENWLDTWPPSTTLASEDAWHPYCISRRVPVWCWLLLTDTAPHRSRQRIIDSIVDQCRHLCDHLEFELGGNHLLENLAALTTVACLIETPESRTWLDVVERVWMKERESQILAHGEHFERSPMYHCQVTANLVRQAVLAREIHPQLAGIWREDASRMLEFLLQILHPDGELPLFADSGWHESPPVREISLLAEIAGIGPAPETSSASHRHRFAKVGDYWTARWPEAGMESFVIFDGGDVAAQHLPAHGHADPGTLEISIAGNRWITDSGNFAYEPGPMRDYCRSSMAHNVLTVGGRNSCHVWGGFRMGQRAEILGFESGTVGETGWAIAIHNGYRNVGLQSVRRCVAVDSEGNVLVADTPEGEAVAPLIGYIHLAPGITAVPASDSSLQWKLSDGTVTRWLCFSDVENVVATKGWYCPEFGKRLEATVLAYQRSGRSSAPLMWQLSVVQSQVRFDGIPIVPVRH